MPRHQIAQYTIDGVNITIEDSPTKRRMRISPRSIYSVIYLDPDAIKQPAFYTVQTIAGSMPSIRRALVLGAGGCTVPRFLSKRFASTIHIDVVEYSPEIIDICREHFMAGIDPETLTFITADGFQYVKECPAYDFIFVDMYIESAQAGDFMSPAFLADLRRATTPDSIVIINLYPKQTSEECQDWVQQAQQVFPAAQAIKHSNDSNYYMVLADHLDE